MTRKPMSPFGDNWKFVTVLVKTCRDGCEKVSQLWKHKRTGELRWHTQ